MGVGGEEGGEHGMHLAGNTIELSVLSKSAQRTYLRLHPGCHLPTFTDTILDASAGRCLTESFATRGARTTLLRLERILGRFTSDARGASLGLGDQRGRAVHARGKAMGGGILELPCTVRVQGQGCGHKIKKVKVRENQLLRTVLRRAYLFHRERNRGR